MKLGPVEWMVGAVGASLLVAAVMDESPWGIVLEAFTGTGRQPISKPSTRTALVGANAAAAGAVGGSTGVVTLIDDVATNILGNHTIGAIHGTPADLVPIPTHPTFKLRAGPAAGFVQFERVYGRSIEMTGTYRDYATQARQYAADPSRFAPPDSSAHVRGEAVDIDLGRTGIPNPKRGDPAYDRLLAAGQATGWCFSALDRKPGSSKDAEPWHVSFYGCR